MRADADVAAAHVIGVFESAERAQEAIGALQATGFDTSKLSVLGKEYPSEAHHLGLATVGARARVWGRHGALWNSVAESPSAMALAWVPFIGHIMAVGPMASTLLRAQWETRADAQPSALARMLTSGGLSAGESRALETAVRGGQILVLVHGPAKYAARARRLLQGAAPQSVD